MICPYRKVIVHQPEIREGEKIRYQREYEEFADCYGKECPFYGEYWTNGDETDIHGVCKRASKEIEE